MVPVETCALLGGNAGDVRPESVDNSTGATNVCGRGNEVRQFTRSGYGYPVTVLGYRLACVWGFLSIRDPNPHACKLDGLSLNDRNGDGELHVTMKSDRYRVLADRLDVFS
jgi:hypothetical protein